MKEIKNCSLLNIYLSHNINILFKYLRMNKKCILIEADPSNSLGGSCINDLIYTANYLEGFVNEINILTTSNIDDSRVRKFPRHCNFFLFDKQILIDLLNNISDNSTIFVLISGHGYQKIDLSNDEIDGKDEYIRSKKSIILDDDLRDIFIVPLKEKNNINFIGMIDTCHSGSMFDLDYSFNGNEWIIDTKRELLNVNAISIGACKDNQLDNCDLGNIGFGGSLTVHMIDNDLIKDLFDLKKVKNTYFKLLKILKKLNQTPVLQSNIIF